MFIELEALDGSKLSVNSMYIVSAKPLTDKQTEFVLLKRLDADGTVVDSQTHQVDCSYSEFMNAVMTAMQQIPKLAEDGKLKLG